METNDIKRLHIITREIDQYDQEGEYFYAAFSERPTLKRLAKLLCNTDKLENLNDAQIMDIAHLYRGGGRKSTEYEWFNLREVAAGQVMKAERDSREQ